MKIVILVLFLVRSDKCTGNAILASTAANATKTQNSAEPVAPENEDSRYQSKRSVGFRAGFQGHITAMGNAILRISQKRPDVRMSFTQFPKSSYF